MACTDRGSTTRDFPEESVDPAWNPVTDSDRKCVRAPLAGGAGGGVREDAGWGHILTEFCQNTSIHALRQMTEPTPFVARRVVWAVILVAGLGLFVSQTVNSTFRYFSREMAVDMKVTYNDTLTFPAVTLCNQNAFRSSRLAELGLYGPVSDLFGQGRLHADPNTEAIQKGVLQQLPLDQLYMDTAHSKHDLIVSCWWAGKRCSPADFETTLTDFGVCYTFNGRKSKTLRTVRYAGADQALRLHVNLEQYEYTRGPHLGAGLRLLLHPQGVGTPRPGLQGLVLPPAAHALVGVSFNQMRSLPPPYGQCADHLPLHYYPTYSQADCLADCRQRFLLRRCGCRDFYMPPAHHRLNYPKVCTVRQYVTCAVPVLRLFERISAVCHCPPHCIQTTFDPTVTLGTNSNFDLERKLRHSTDSLQEKYTRAREASQRVNDVTVTSDRRLLTSLEAAVRDVEVGCETLRRTLTVCLEGLRATLEEVKGRTDFHVNRALWGVKFNIKHNFIRGWKIKAESTINYVTSSFHEIRRSISRAMKDHEIKISTNEKTKPDGCNTDNIRLLLLESKLQEKIDLVQEARRDLVEVNSSYAMGKPLSSASPFSVLDYDRSTAPTALIQSKSRDRNMYVKEILEASSSMEQGLEGLLGTVQGLASKRSCNTSDVEDLVSKYEVSCRRFNHNRYMLTDRVIERPLQVINRRIDKVLRLNRTLEDHYTTVQEAGSQLVDILDISSKSYWNSVKHIITIYNVYMTNETMLKSYLYSYVTAASTVAAVGNVTRFFDTLRSHGVELRTNLRHMHHANVKLYQYMLQETTTRALYTLLKDQLLESLTNRSRAAHLTPRLEQLLARPLGGGSNLSELLLQVNADFSGSDVRGLVRPLEQLTEQFVSDSRVYSALEEAEKALQEALSDLNHSLHAFHRSNKLDAAFFKENFLSLDIFFQEMRFTEISQQVAYDSNNLWGDIGGSVGLFVGASVITVFEVIDVFVHNAFRLLSKGKS